MDIVESGKGGSVRRYHHGNLREALVQEALALLETQSQGEISLRELARRVGVSPNAVYRHFPDKEALLAALAANGFKRFAALQADAFRAAPDPKSGFRGMGRAYVDFARANPALFRLMFGRFCGTPDAKRDETLIEAGSRASEGLRFGVMQATGIQDESDPTVRVLALRAWSLVHGLSMLVLDLQVAAVGDELEQLIDGVLASESLFGGNPPHQP